MHKFTSMTQVQDAVANNGSIVLDGKTYCLLALTQSNIQLKPISLQSR